MQNNDRLFVIIGASGFLGSTICEELKKLKKPTIGLNRDYGWFYDKNNQNKFTRNKWPEIAKNFNELSIVYAAWSSFPRTNYPYQGIKFEHKQNLVPLESFFKDEMHRVDCNNITSIFFSSGGEVYGDGIGAMRFCETDQLAPRSIYGEGKVLGEEMYLTNSTKTCKRSLIFRLANPYGKHQFSQTSQGVIAQLIRCSYLGEKFFLYGADDPERDYFLANDLCQLITKIERFPSGGHVYNVGTGVGTKLSQLIEQVDASTGNATTVKNLPNLSSGNRSAVLNCEKLRLLFPELCFTNLPTGLKMMRKYLGDMM